MRWSSGTAFILFLVCVSNTHARGDLTWECTSIDVKLGLADHAAKASFAFVNNGKSEVRILGIERSCGCTTTSLKKTSYEPGEGGTIGVEVEVSDLAQQFITRTVVAKTNENGAGQALRIRIVEPNVAFVTPAELKWLVGGPSDVKTARVAVNAGLTIRPVNVSCQNAAIAVQMSEVEKGQIVSISVRPLDTGGSVIDDVIVAADISDGKSTVRKSFRIAVRIDYDL